MPGPATFERSAFKSRLFAKGLGSYPSPWYMAVVFGERPDSRTSARMLLSYGITMTVFLLPQRDCNERKRDEESL